MTDGTTENLKRFDALERLDTPEAVTRYQRKRGRDVLSERKRTNFEVARFIVDGPSAGQGDVWTHVCRRR